MINSSEWLNKNFPNEDERWRVEEIHINEQLEGELNLKDFTNWNLKIYLYPNLDKRKIQIINVSEDTETLDLLDAQKWLKENYPKEGVCSRENETVRNEEIITNNQGKRRDEITNLDISEKSLSGSLDLSDFINLESLDCSNNKITSLSLKGCDKLININCSNNKLTSFDWLTSFSGDNLTSFYFRGNQVPSNFQELFENSVFTYGEFKSFAESGLDPKNYKFFNLWKNQGFSNQEIKTWVEIGLKDNEYLLASWLAKEKKYQLKKFPKSELKKLRKNYCDCWTKIDKRFDEKANEETYQQLWEEEGFSFLEANEWIESGLEVDEFYRAKWWKEESFSPKSSKRWIELLGSDGYKFAKKWEKYGFTANDFDEWEKIGLKKNDYKLSNWIFNNKLLSPEKIGEKNLESLREEFSQVKNYLDWKYPKPERKNIKKLDISKKNLKGTLKLEDFINLEELDCSNNLLSDLDLDDLDSKKITELDLRDNDLDRRNLDFLSKFTNLKKLWLGNSESKQERETYNRFYGSLKPLEKLTNLKILDIRETDIDRGIEYLSESLDYFFYHNENHHRFIANKGCGKIAKELSSYHTEGSWPYGDDFYFPPSRVGDDLKRWKNDNLPSFHPKSNNKEKKEIEKDSKEWTDIHPNFGKSSPFGEKTYQQEWEEQSLNLEESEKWIKAGLKLEEFEMIKKFSLKHMNPSDFAKKFQKERKAQEWVDYFYSFFDPLLGKIDTFTDFLRNSIETLDIKDKSLTGTLDLRIFPNLKKIDCSWNEITELNIENNPKLEEIICSNNYSLFFLSFGEIKSLEKISCGSCDLKELDLSKFKKLKSLNFQDNQINKIILPLDAENLTFLDLSNNKIKNLSIFSYLANLKYLYLNNNPISGNLEPLKKCHKLVILEIRGTNINPTWEHLSNRIEKINKKGQWNEIYKELEDFQEQDKRGSAYYNLIEWRKEQKGFKKIKSILEKVDSNLDANEVIKEFKDFNVKTGDFEGEYNKIFSFIEKNNEENLVLRFRVQELTNLTKEQRKKIFDAYLRFAPEKELLRNLINKCLEYSRAKKERQPVKDLRKQFETIRDEMEEKVDEKFFEEIQIIIADCEDLIQWEIELERKQKKFIDDSYNQIDICLFRKGDHLSGNVFNNQWGKNLTKVINNYNAPIKNHYQGKYAGLRIEYSNIGAIGDQSQGTINNRNSLISDDNFTNAIFPEQAFSHNTLQKATEFEEIETIIEQLDLSKKI
ncbi:MAG: hypothetical protein mread185_000661 [Mycoplasmataceae bacterium]|nr:MAG: hypothetical protein mread185_000661 [Mycoplasmataceae bacterium]